MYNFLGNNMKIFVINYDLRKARDYDILYQRLTELGGNRVLESVWTLKLNDKYTCADIRDDLRRYMDSDDGLYVAHISSAAWDKVDNTPHRYED